MGPSRERPLGSGDSEERKRVKAQGCPEEETREPASSKVWWASYPASPGQVLLEGAPWKRPGWGSQVQLGPREWLKRGSEGPEAK